MSIYKKYQFLFVLILFVFLFPRAGASALILPFAKNIDLSAGALTQTTSGIPVSSVWADFNNDGRPDLAIADNNHSNSTEKVKVYLFGPGNQVLNTSEYSAYMPTSIKAADLNSDGYLDLVYTSWDFNNITVMFNNGDGTFAAKLTKAVGSTSIDLTINDFNNDGKPDVAVLSGSNLIVYLNTATDSTKAINLTQKSSIALGATAYSLISGDFDQDGYKDIIVSNQGKKTLQYYRGAGDGSMTLAREWGNSKEDWHIASGYFNNDSYLDFAVATLDGFDFFINNGLSGASSNFTSTHISSALTAARFLTAGDFNRDGLTDVALENLTDSQIKVYLNNGDSTFSEQSESYYGLIRNNVVAHVLDSYDFNSDGNLDLVTYDQINTFISFILGQGNGKFGGSYQALATDGSASWVAAGDLDGDGDQDLAAVQSGNANVKIYTNDGAGNFSWSKDLTGSSSANNVVIADFNGDGLKDIAFSVAAADSNNVGVLLNQGSLNFSAAAYYSIGGLPASLASGDFNHDGAADLVIPATDDVKMLLNKNNSSGTFQNPTSLAIGYGVGLNTLKTVSVGDFNGDGWDDFAVPNINRQVFHVFKNNQDGTFTLTQLGGATGSESGSAIVDLNNDGYDDLITNHYSAGKVKTFFANSSGSLAAGSEYTALTNTYPATLAVGDFNNDGSLDFASVDRGRGGNLFLGFNNGAGIFSTSTYVYLGGTPYNAAAADFNNDGKVDLAVANGSAVQVMLNSYVAPGLAITQSGSTTNVAEGGAIDTYTVSLTTQPCANVTVTLNPNSEVTVSPNNLTFTSSNWQTPQTVTVTAVDDGDIEGNHTGTITHTLTSSDADYVATATAAVTINITDNDFAEVILSKTTASVTENGAADSYTAVLSSPPAANVTVNLNLSNAQATTSPATLTFTTVNWQTPQTVNLGAVDDKIADGNQSVTISHSVTSSDTNFNGITVPEVTVTVVDNDTAGVSLDNTTLTVVEGGATASEAVVLDSQPTAEVVIDISLNNTQATTSPATLTFTTANWQTPQTFTIAAVDDKIDDGNQTSTVSLAASSSDGNYNGLTISDISLTVSDNDVSGITLDKSSVAVAEGGTIATYSLVLTSEPTNEVVVNISTDGKTTISPNTLAFTTANWQTPQTVTVTAVNDSLVEGTHTSLISQSVSSLDSNYNNYSLGAVTATITDNDFSGGGGLLIPQVKLPPAGLFKLTINNGASETKQQQVNLTFTTGSDIKRFAVSEDLNFTAASQLPLVDNYIFTLSPNNGLKTIYAKFFNDYGMSSPVVSASINFSSLTPAANSTGGKEAGNSTTANQPNSSQVLFSRNLRLGFRGDDVKNLQIFLNNHGFEVAANGPGSRGQETVVFGYATHKALIRFQEAHAKEILTPSGLKRGTGWFWPATRNYINQLLTAE